MDWWPLLPGHIECFSKQLHYSAQVLVGLIDKCGAVGLLLRIQMEPAGAYCL